MFAARAAFMSGKSKPPSGSAYFDGTGDYLGVTGVTATGANYFTFEFWWYPLSLSGYQSPYDRGYVASGALLLQTGNGDGKINVYASGGVAMTSSTSVTLNAWNHIALSKTNVSGKSLVLHQNGVVVASTSTSYGFTNTGVIGIGGSAGNNIPYPINGYISNFRLYTTGGSGDYLYSESFTPPTAPLTAITGTQLLTCQSSTTITDASTNNYTITKYGNVAANALNPF